MSGYSSIAAVGPMLALLGAGLFSTALLSASRTLVNATKADTAKPRRITTWACLGADAVLGQTGLTLMAWSARLLSTSTPSVSTGGLLLLNLGFFLVYAPAYAWARRLEGPAIPGAGLFTWHDARDLICFVTGLALIVISPS